MRGFFFCFSNTIQVPDDTLMNKKIWLQDIPTDHKVHSDHRNPRSSEYLKGPDDNQNCN